MNNFGPTIRTRTIKKEAVTVMGVSRDWLAQGTNQERDRSNFDAEEVNYPGFRANPGDLATPSNWTANPVPHIHLGGVGTGHIPVEWP